MIGCFAAPTIERYIGRHVQVSDRRECGMDYPWQFDDEPDIRGFQQ